MWLKLALLSTYEKKIRRRSEITRLAYTNRKQEDMISKCQSYPPTSAEPTRSSLGSIWSPLKCLLDPSPSSTTSLATIFSLLGGGSRLQNTQRCLYEPTPCMNVIGVHICGSVYHFPFALTLPIPVIYYIIAGCHLAWKQSKKVKSRSNQSHDTCVISSI